MIRERHVLRMKIPFPSLKSRLACSAHMYICMESQYPEYRFVKCQTLKPYMLYEEPMKKYCDEEPDITRNPFVRMTRIDCDNSFSTSGVEYDDRLLTTSRPDICAELFAEISAKRPENDIPLNEEELVLLNPLITRVKH